MTTDHTEYTDVEERRKDPDPIGENIWVELNVRGGNERRYGYILIPTDYTSESDNFVP